LAFAGPTRTLKWVIENCTEFTAHKGTDYEDLSKDVRALVQEKLEELYHGCVMTQ
jgi:hypothetical protein